MALTITGAVSVTTADRLQIRTMLIAALGCNLAWGIIDAGMYLMARLGERGRTALVAQAVRETTDRENAHRLIANELPPPLAAIFRQSELELIREKINQLPHSASGPRLSGRDWLGALGVFVLVVVSTFPVVIHFFSSRTPYGRCARPTHSQSQCCFCAGSFSDVMRGFGRGPQAWLW